MKNLTSALIALALFSAGASAQQSVGAGNGAGSLVDELTADGLTPISDGFYGRRNGGDESYVAFTPAGQQALLQRLLELRNDQPHVQKKGAQTPNALDQLIDALSFAPLTERERYGDCNGVAATGPFHVVASAVGGVAASASAANSSSPTIATTNYAYANALDTGSNTVGNNATTANNVTATASINAPNSRTACQTMSAATITCSGASQPAISTFAMSTVPGKVCLQ